MRKTLIITTAALGIGMAGCTTQQGALVGGGIGAAAVGLAGGSLAQAIIGAGVGALAGAGSAGSPAYAITSAPDSASQCARKTTDAYRQSRNTATGPAASASFRNIH